jgi:hypothetical protein
VLAADAEFVGFDFHVDGDDKVHAEVGHLEAHKGAIIVFFYGIFFGGWAVAIFRFTIVIRTGIDVIGSAVAIAVRRASVWGTAIFRIAGLFGGQVFFIGNGIAIKIGSTTTFSRSRLVRVCIHVIGNPIPVTIRAALHIGKAGLFGASVVFIENTIAVGIAGGGTAVAIGQTGFIGASVLGVWNTIVVPVIGERAAIACRTGFVGAGIDLVGDAVAIPVGKLNGFHIDRAVGTPALAIEGAHGQGVETRGCRLPIGEKREGSNSILH